MANGRREEQQTRSIAQLVISAHAYDEIATKLRNADYHHVFLPDGTIDMNGLGLIRLAEREQSQTSRG